MRVHAYEKRPGITGGSPIVAHGLRYGENVAFVKAACMRRAAMAGGPERHWPFRQYIVICRDETWHISQMPGLSRLACVRMNGHDRVFGADSAP